MCSEGIHPCERRRAEGKKDEDRGSGEALVLDVFRGRERGFGGLCESFVILQNATSFSATQFSQSVLQINVHAYFVT